MTRYDYDLFVIGGGSGGVRAARMSSQFGARVALVEERYLGGTCVNVGCVPKKLLVYGSELAHEIEDATGYGWSVGEAQFDWAKLISNKNAEISRLNSIYARLLNEANVDLLEGRGTLIDPHTVAVNDKHYTSRYILICTGSWPLIPALPGQEHIKTSNDVFFLDRLPERIILVGGGYIAVEFAGIFNGLGAQVTQLYRGPRLLRGFDEDVRRFLEAELIKKGIDLRLNVNITAVEKVEKTASGYRSQLSDGSSLDSDLVVFATGRTPLTANMGLEEIGVALGPRNGIVVDEEYRTSVTSIFALGDVIDKVQLTPVAIAEGMTVARNLFQGANERLDYRDIPTAVFSQPPVGTVGLTEAEARKACEKIKVFKSEFTPMKHTLTGRAERTLMKLIVDEASDRVVGVHMVGPEAGEIIQGLSVAIKCGATKAQFDATVAIHPTAAEEFVTMYTAVAEPAPANPAENA